MKARLALVAILALSAVPALAQVGSDSHPITVRMGRGTDSVTYRGVMKPGVDCCAYRFKARAGQVLVWSESGAAVRTTLRYPGGDMDGPGLPNRIALPDSGTYVFAIHPNLMADGGYGPFSLTLTIPAQPGS